MVTFVTNFLQKKSYTVAVDAKIAVTKRKAAALANLFRSLLHQLMTAQIRLKEINMLELETTQ